MIGGQKNQNTNQRSNIVTNSTKMLQKIKRWKRPKETSKAENYWSYKSYHLSEYWSDLQVVSRLLGVKFGVWGLVPGSVKNIWGPVEAWEADPWWNTALAYWQSLLPPEWRQEAKSGYENHVGSLFLWTHPLRGGDCLNQPLLVFFFLLPSPPMWIPSPSPPQPS